MRSWRCATSTTQRVICSFSTLVHFDSWNYITKRTKGEHNYRRKKSKLRSTQGDEAHKRRASSWLWNPGQTSPEVQNRDMSGLTKRTYVLQNFKKKLRCMQQNLCQFSIYIHQSGIQSSFPVIHKVGNVGIFVQLLMRINCKCLPMKSILLQMFIYHDTLN